MKARQFLTAVYRKFDAKDASSKDVRRYAIGALARLDREARGRDEDDEDDEDEDWEDDEDDNGTDVTDPDTCGVEVVRVDFDDVIPVGTMQRVRASVRVFLGKEDQYATVTVDVIPSGGAPWPSLSDEPLVMPAWSGSAWMEAQWFKAERGVSRRYAPECVLAVIRDAVPWKRSRLTYGSDATTDAECIWYSPACLSVRPTGQLGMFDATEAA